MPRPVHVEAMQPSLDPAAVDDLRDRLRRTRYVTMADDDPARGVRATWLAEVLADWQAVDAEAFHRRLSALTHRRVDVGGRAVHVVVAEGRGPDPLPLLLGNGWPSSFWEYADVLPLLTDPQAHGGTSADAFTVVVPTLPGFGFSAPPPPGGLSAHDIAELWHAVMTQGFGHPRFVAHGSDLSSRIVALLARAHPDSVAAIHLASPSLPATPEPRTPDEQRYADEVEAWAAEEGSYAHQHSTKPWTLGAALNDSPAGLAAWIGEKVESWSSRDTEGRTAFSRTLLLDTLTLYWATGTITSSTLPYWQNGHDPAASLPLDDPSPVPVAISLFGGERVPFARPSREIAQRYHRVEQWTEHDTGGHFPAAAEPELFARTLREVLRRYR